MKKTLLAAATLSVLLTSGAAFAQPTDPSTGNIIFEGAVTNAACSVSDLKIDLGKPTVNLLKDARSYGDEEKGTLTFKECHLVVPAEAGDEVVEGPVESVFLNILPGTKVAKDGFDDLWASTGSATNVGVKVIIQSQPIAPTGTTAPIEASVNEGTATYNVMGQIISAGNATAGSVDTTLRFKADYK